ncbi:MAG: hypothetical protein PHC28_02500 [Flavobacterium sp.]|uniref:hypothetical protein n=1 Tax=Flavobacterium sp. TaxID=239 RepID=UPI00261BBE35|nr:hypothetical protein [Flavobacterium sp.]MDD5149337.1 hypothetical protein [Flavobacterium sp.]
MSKNVLFFICAILISLTVNAQKKTSSYYSLGSTEDEVLKIQGQPTSISKIGNSTTYFYSYSYVSFENGKVESYNNSAHNLKIKIKPQSPKPKKIGKFVYFQFLNGHTEFDNFSGKFIRIENEISDIYSIPNYTTDKQSEIEFCISKSYKEWTGENVILIPVVSGDKNTIITLWKTEQGKVSTQGFLCGQHTEEGIMLKL